MVAGAAESQAPRATSSSSQPYLTVLATVVTPIPWIGTQGPLRPGGQGLTQEEAIAEVGYKRHL